MYFYPRSPCGERPSQGADFGHKMNFYPRSPCGERPLTDDVSTGGEIFLSTLSLRRATLAGMSDKLIGSVFLSTLSLRRATLPRLPPCAAPRYFYPRSPCGERHGSSTPSSTPPLFLSTLSLRRATPMPLIRFCPGTFLSTLSLRRATSASYNAYLEESISIHALLAESDYKERPGQKARPRFLSTLSLRRATAGTMGKSNRAIISIHALLAESDQ